MKSMPKNFTRQLAVPEVAGRRRAAVPLLASLLAVTVFSACAPREPAPAPLPPIAAPALPGTVQDLANYRIQPGDQLRVKFLYHPELDVKVPVAPDGNLNIPSVGEVGAEGKTSAEVAAEVEKISGEMLRDPEVTVIVAEFGERIVYVGGEVRLPGPVRYREGMTPLQAILDRGGFTEVARTDSVLHLSPNGASYDARRLDYTTDVNQFDPEQATLGVYDVIYVPRTFIGDANAFVRLYIRGLMPTMPRVGIGFSP
jgi:protein involved in polysaccharide export with SLBB domain